jgi:hypothetical protein
MQDFKQKLAEYITSYKDWACWPVPRQLTCHVNLFSAFRVAGGKPLPLLNFYTILIRLLEAEPSISEAGETWVRNMVAAEFCLQSIFFMPVRFFYMP